MLSCRQVLPVAAILAAAFGSATPSFAGVVTYSDFASWSAATVGVTTNVTIPDPAPLAYIGFGSGTASVTYSGVVFATDIGLGNSLFFNVGSEYTTVPAVLSSQVASFGVENILITLPGQMTGFALSYGTFDGSNVTFTLSNGEVFTQTSSGSGYATKDFFGVTDTTVFQSVLVTSPDFVLNINNPSFTNAPEPNVWFLFTTGITGLIGYGRRRKRIV